MALGAKTKVRANLVAFVVLGLGLAYAMATQVLSILEDRYSVFAIFHDAGGVFTNQEVTYRGVTVGQVGAMEVVEEGVRIELEIDEDTRIPAEGTEARVMFKSAVGEQFVDLLPVAEGAPYLHDGSVIPLERTSIPVSTQELLSTLEAVLRGVPPEALEGAIDALGRGLTGRGPDIATILESTADLAEMFAERAPEVEGILKKGTRVGGAFLRSRRDFAAAIRDLVSVSESLAASRGNLERLMHGSNLTSDELLALIRERRTALNEFLVEFAALNDLQAEHADDLDRVLAHLPAALGGVAKTFEPATGLVRFSLINESEAPACDYGTERRAPQDRSPRFPPKRARCGDRPGDHQGGAAGEDASTPLLPGVNETLPLDVSDGPSLPSKMSDWSWSLFYLNAL